MITRYCNLKQNERQEIKLEVQRVEVKTWEKLGFHKHHYLTSELNKSAKCFVVSWNNEPLGFIAILNSPGKDRPHDMSISRIVVLPDFQGLGVSGKIIDLFGGIVKSIGEDYRLCIKTIHEKMGKHLENSNCWKPSAHNGKYRKDLEKEQKGTHKNVFARKSYCYTYCGESNNEYKDLLLDINTTREIHNGQQFFDF